MKFHRSIYSSILLLGLLLGVHNGNVALWKDNDPDPIYVSPYPVSMLPAADQALLQKGIRFKNFKELSVYIEDYFS